jgi:hypothetical protein
MQKRVEFERCGLLEPGESGRAIDQDVIDLRAAGVPRNRESLHSFRREIRSIFSRNASPDIVVDYLRLREPCGRVQELMQPCALDCVTVDLENGFVPAVRACTGRF